LNKRQPKVVVLGSVHMDLIATADRLPGPGESVAGGTFLMAPGGKGGNQAVQFALAGAEVHMLTRLGDDGFGRELLAALRAKGVGTSLVAIDPRHPTGASTVFGAHGDYCSIIAPGAAARLSADDVERSGGAIEQADALVLQLELPPSISDQAARIAVAKGRAVVLNASPAPADWSEVPDSLWRAASIMVVNRVEAARLLRREIQPEGLNEAMRELASCFAITTIVVTLGPQGSAALCTTAASSTSPLFPRTSWTRSGRVTPFWACSAPRSGRAWVAPTPCGAARRPGLSPFRAPVSMKRCLRVPKWTRI
jgi:ribokinase